jgi:tetratricopeptide (TPR) repeat protein
MVTLKSGRHVYNGLSVRGASDLITQIKESRKAGTDGICGFTFNASSGRPNLAKALSSQLYPTWVPTPPMSWKPALPNGGPAKPAGPKAMFDKAIAVAATDKGLDEATALLEQVVREDPNFTEAHFRLGRCYLRKGMNTKAAYEFRQALELDANHKGAEEELRKVQSKE